MKPTIIEVKTRKELRRFVHYPNKMYKDNPYYVPTLEKGDRDALDPKKNHAFEFCEGTYWLALDDNGRIVGRIAGIINRIYNRKSGINGARFGFMDFIDDDEVVDALFDTVENWARKKGMKRIIGPQGFLEFDASGVLVEGFDQLPTAYGKYNFPYYDAQLVRRGYGKDTDWVEMRITLPDQIDTLFERPARIIAERLHLRQAEIRDKKEMAAWFDKCVVVLNQAYSKLHGFTELSPGQVEDLKKQFVPNLNPDFVSIIIDEQDEVVGFGISLPSLSRALQKCRGRLFPLGFLHILHALKHNDTLDSLLIGIRNGYKNQGIHAMIFNKLSKTATRMGIKYIESTRQLEDNLNVQNLWNRFDHTLTKRARCYVKNL